MKNSFLIIGFILCITNISVVNAATIKYFQPPQEKDIPDNEFGKLINQGRNVFVDTQKYAKPYVGNSLNCVNCHLDAGRLKDSAPLWGAYGMYPAYRSKTKKVDTLENRIQGCFMYSMNGKAPAVDAPEMKALVVYMYWMSTNSPVGKSLPGRAYPELKKPGRVVSWNAGEIVFQNNCMICHGRDGNGQYVDGKTVFPPLWGKNSFNWGAGMHRINTAAGFIKANMPLGLGGKLTDQEAWDVAFYINSHERPKDPRQKGSLEEAKKEFHDENCSYGQEINGQKLGI
jgi:thiosulfate dehydrogenase